MPFDSAPCTFPEMGNRATKTPREGKTPTEYKEVVARRIKARRQQLGLSIPAVAERLSAAIGREIVPDSYRKWETTSSIVQVDAILPLCDILQLHVFALLARESSAVEDTAPLRQKKAGRSAN